MNIAMIGLGRMGFPMARHMHEAGHDVVCYDVSEAARARTHELGIPTSASIDVVSEVELICSSLPATAEVTEAYGQIFQFAKAGAVCADLSTISVEGSRELARVATEHGLSFLDTPVSGTSIHAEAANLVIMVGGSPEALEVARPALETFSTTIEHVGDNGSGLLLKLLTNRLLTSHVVAIGEAVLDLEAVGLNVTQGLDIIASGAVAKLLDYKSAPLANRDFTPTFTVNLMRKDLRLAALALPEARLGSVAREILEEAGEAGHGEDDLAAIITALEKNPT